LKAVAGTATHKLLAGRGQECPRHTIVKRRIKHFHAGSITYTKIQRLSSKITKTAIRSDFSLWKSFRDPEDGSSCKSRATGLPAALASILRGRQHEEMFVVRTRSWRQRV